MAKKLTKEIFANRANVIHNMYDYSLVNFINTRTKVIIVCPKHGKFDQTPNAHLSGQGCSKCNLFSLECFIEKASLIHKNKYDYSLVYIKNYRTNIEIVCPIHGNFFKSPVTHLSLGQGCPKCSMEHSISIKLSNISDFIKKSELIHNHKYDYSKSIYLKNNIKCIIICPIHGEFLQTPCIHLRGSGCPRCARKNNSKLENEWLDLYYIDNKFRQYYIYHKDDLYKADGFDPITNTIYEFYGDYWHGNPKLFNSNEINVISKKYFGELYEKTIEREKLLLSLGYNIISIWENDFRKFKKRM